MAKLFDVTKEGKGVTKEQVNKRKGFMLFLDIYFRRFWKLALLNLFYMIASIPAIFISYKFVQYALIFYMQLARISPENTEAVTAAIRLTPVLMAIIIHFCGTGPVTAGFNVVLRKYVEDKHAWVWADFLRGSKENWKQALGLSAITSVVPFLAWMCYQFYGELAAQNWMMAIPQTFSLMVAGVWFLALTYAYPMLVTYKMSFFTLIKNSVLLAVGRLPLSVGIRLLLLLPVVLGVALTFLLGNVWVPLVLAAYYVLIGFALSRFVTASYTNAQFDKYINVRIEGAKVNRGMAEADDEEYEEEEEAERELKPWENGYASQDK